MRFMKPPGLGIGPLRERLARFIDRAERIQDTDTAEALAKGVELMDGAFGLVSKEVLSKVRSNTLKVGVGDMVGHIVKLVEAKAAEIEAGSAVSMDTLHGKAA